MEYYIMKKYQKEKERQNVENGFGRYFGKTKVKIIICFVVMFLSLGEMMLTIFFFPTQLWYWIGVAMTIASFVVLKIIDGKDEKEHLNRYADSYEMKLDILYELLSTEYKVTTKEKMEELIVLYKTVIKEKEEEEKRRKTVIITLFSAFAGVLSISFTNLNVIGITFEYWLVLAVVLAICVSVIALSIYMENFFDSIKKQYIAMVKDLEELKFKNY